MNILLIFFALPIATIIISIALQKIFKCPPLVAAIIFAIFLIVTFIIGSFEFLIATIIYTIISYITAVIVCILTRILNRLGNNNNCDCTTCNCNTSCQDDTNQNMVLTISADNMANTVNALNTASQVNSMCSTCSRRNTCSCCNCNNENNNNGVTARINVIPNSNINGRTGCLCGSYRRR